MKKKNKLSGPERMKIHNQMSKRPSKRHRQMIGRAREAQAAYSLIKQVFPMTPSPIAAGIAANLVNSGQFKVLK